MTTFPDIENGTFHCQEDELRENIPFFSNVDGTPPFRLQSSNSIQKQRHASDDLEPMVQGEFESALEATLFYKMYPKDPGRGQPFMKRNGGRASEILSEDHSRPALEDWS